MSQTIYVHECGGDLDNKSNEIQVPNGDFALVVDGSRYRFQIDKNGDLILPLINGTDARITTHNGYPAIKLTSR